MTTIPSSPHPHARPPAAGAIPAARHAFRGLLRGDQLLFAIAVSMFVHAGLMFLGSVMMIGLPMGQGSLGGEGGLELAVMSEAELTQLSETRFEGGQIQVNESLQESLPTSDDLTAPLSDAGLVSGGLSDSQMEALGGAGGGSIGSGEGLGGGAVGGGSARFFGVEARGSRFVYLIDVSGSMEGERLRALQKALDGSIAEMLEHTHYCIILFNSDAMALNGPKWTPATAANKKQTSREIANIVANGGTNPLPGFQLAMSLKPRPDAIYFMTDGQFMGGADDQLVSLAGRLNERGDRRTIIHGLTFIERQSEKLMQRLARITGGTYTHVEGTGSANP